MADGLPAPVVLSMKSHNNIGGTPFAAAVGGVKLRFMSLRMTNNVIRSNGLAESRYGDTVFVIDDNQRR